MNRLGDIPISITAEEVLLAQYMGRRTSFSRPIRESAERAIETGRPLFAPAAVYDEFAVQAIEDEELVLAADGREVRLEVGPKIDLLYPARRVIVSVITLGPALERRVDELQAQGEPLDAYMLDSVGVVALGAAGEVLRDLVERRAAELSWGVSEALAPGSLVGWHLRGQRQICALVPPAPIGVELSAACVLQPHKSATMLVGLGPDYPSGKVGSVCRFCSLSDTCWRSKKERVLA